MVGVTTKNTTDSLTFAVLTAIADRLGEDVTALPSLHNTIDTEALDALFAPRSNGTPRGDGRVTFSYAGHTITVDSDGHVELREQK